MADPHKFEIEKVTSISGEQLNDTVLKSALDNALVGLETGDDLAGSFSTKIDTWLKSLGKLQYVESSKTYGVKLDGKYYIFSSLGQFEKDIERVVLSLEEIDETIAAHATMVEGIEIKKLAIQEETVVLQQEVLQQNYDFEQFMNAETLDMHRPNMFDLLSMKKDNASYKAIEQYIAGKKKENPEYSASVESVSNRIEGVWHEFIDRFLVNINIPGEAKESMKKSMTTGLSLYLMQTYSSGSELGVSLFESEKSLEIDTDNFLGGITTRVKEMGLENIGPLSDLMQFFMVFKDEKVEKALEKMKTHPEGVMNHLLQNPWEFYNLLGKFGQEPMATRTDRLVDQLVNASGTFEKSKFELDTGEVDTMQKIINDSGGDVEMFKHVMGYVEKGEELLEKSEEIKVKMLANDKLATMAGMLGTFKAALGKLGAIFGEDWEKSELFKFIDGIFGFLGFEGVDGFLDEHKVGKTVGPMLAIYAESEHDLQKTKTTTFRTTLTEITNEDARQNEILGLAGEIDIEGVYTLMNEKKENGRKDYIRVAGLKKLVPLAIANKENVTEKELFYYASAFVMERLVNSRLVSNIGEITTEELLKWMMLFAIDPNRSKKYFTIGDSHKKRLKAKGLPIEVVPSGGDEAGHDRNLENLDPNELTKITDLVAGIEQLGIAFKSNEAKERLRFMSSSALLVMYTTGVQFPYLRITSSIRTEEENIAMKEQNDRTAEDSHHMYGHGFDIGRPTANYDASKLDEYEAYFKKVQTFINNEFPEYYTLIHGEGQHRHLHVDTREERDRDERVVNADLQLNDGPIQVDIAHGITTGLSKEAVLTHLGIKTRVAYDPIKEYGRKEYIKLITPLAKEIQEMFGIPLEIIITQALNESGNGDSNLARNDNNFFAIKKHGHWKGPTIPKDDDKPNELFRRYISIEHSFYDYADFLKNQNSSLYGSLFELDPTDYKGRAKGLKTAGYATKATYAEDLIAVIESNGLDDIA